MSLDRLWDTYNQLNSCSCPDCSIKKDAARQAIEAALKAEEREHPLCPFCKQCRVGTDDADRHDCGCVGPCQWHGWDDWLADVVAHH